MPPSVNTGEIDTVNLLFALKWLETLPDHIQKAMREHGFEFCKTTLPFTRYINEMNDLGMDQWLKEHLSTEDFQYHRTPGEHLRDS